MSLHEKVPYREFTLHVSPAIIILIHQGGTMKLFFYIHKCKANANYLCTIVLN